MTGALGALRRATADDVPGLVALADVVLPATYDPVDPAYAGHLRETWWSPEGLRTSVERLPHWVAVRDGEVVGVANLGEHDGEPVMWKLYVRPDQHGSGLGSALLAAVEAAVDGPALTLEHLDGNDHAAAFYRRRGFAVTRRVTGTDTGDTDFPHLSWTWMRKDL